MHSLSPPPVHGLLAPLRVVSLSHRTCGLSALSAIVSHGDSAHLRDALAACGIESVVLSTCNRLEVYWRAVRTTDDDQVGVAIESALPTARDYFLRDASVRQSGDAAARHLFRVCCGLDSLVVGEAEILGQARAAMEQSPGVGALLRGVFTAAIRTGRSARAETAIGVGAMSVASTAIHQLTSRLSLPSSRVLIVGAGETAAKAVRHLMQIGVGELVIANRSLERAEALAATHQGRAVGLDTIAAEIADADAVICAAASGSYLVGRAHVERRSEPIVLVDLSMPPVIEPFELPHVTRVDLPGLQRATDAHREDRQHAVPDVEAVIEREMAWLRAWARQEMLRPFVSTLRQKVDAIRRDELARAQKELDGDHPERVLERLSKRMFDRLLALPIDQLKNGDLPFDAASADYLRRLFALDEAVQ